MCCGWKMQTLLYGFEPWTSVPVPPRHCLSGTDDNVTLVVEARALKNKIKTNKIVPDRAVLMFKADGYFTRFCLEVCVRACGFCLREFFVGPISGVHN